MRLRCGKGSDADDVLKGKNGQVSLSCLPGCAQCHSACFLPVIEPCMLISESSWSPPWLGFLLLIRMQAEIRGDSTQRVFLSLHCAEASQDKTLKLKRNPRDSGRVSLGQRAGQTGVCQPATQGYPAVATGKLTEKGIFAGTQA